LRRAVKFFYPQTIFTIKHGILNGEQRTPIVRLVFFPVGVLVMATPKRTRATSTTTRSKKTDAAQAVETTILSQSHGNAEELIRYRAYQLFEQRGRNHGFDMEDWLRAEVEVVKTKAQSA
jgi:hypothetical protein